MLLQQQHLLLMLQVFINQKKMAYNDFNGRWRAGIQFAKFRSKN